MATHSKMGKTLTLLSLIVICVSLYRGCLNHSREKRKYEKGEDPTRIELDNVASERKEGAASRSDDARSAEALALLLKAMVEAQQAQRESTRQSRSRFDPGMAGMMNYKSSYSSGSPPVGHSSSSRSPSSYPSWECRYCGLVINNRINSIPPPSHRCPVRALGADPGPHVFDKK